MDDFLKIWQDNFHDNNFRFRITLFYSYNKFKYESYFNSDYEKKEIIVLLINNFLEIIIKFLENK